MSLSPRICLAIGCLFPCVLSVGPQTGAASEAVSFKGEKFWSDTTAISVTGTLSKPDGQGPFPAVVLLPNCGGPKPFEFAKFWPRYLNKLGYVTLNVDHFTPRKAKKCTKKFKPNAKIVAQDAYGALTYLAGLAYVDKNRVGVFGSSLGALAINWFSGLGKSTPEGLMFGAAVSLYPSHCKKVSPSAGMIPTTIILGDKEKGVATCQRLSQSERLSVNIFPGIYHGFDQPSATPLKKDRLRKDLGGNKRLYNKPATEKAKALVKEFLSAKLSESNAPAEASAPVKVEQTYTPRLGKVGGKDPYKGIVTLTATVRASDSEMPPFMPQLSLAAMTPFL